MGIGFLIFIHELGHYFAAKRAKMTVEVFSIGFGRPIYSWQRGVVKWQIGSLPFGGYVKIAGMEKKGHLEPYQIKDGFFGKKPIERIKVSLAGPFANILFALLAFSFIWVLGGRNKPFSEHTKKIGLIDKKSDLYKNEIRPGDEILSYKNRVYTGFNDIIYNSLLDEKRCEIKGVKIDYLNQVRVPFQFDLETSSAAGPMGSLIHTLGIQAPASFLIYKESSSKTEDFSAISGMLPKDRLIWANGEIIFSRFQLSSLLNENCVYLTLKRKENYFHVKLAKVKVQDVNLNKFDKEEIDDWRHEIELKTKLSDLYILPYYFNENGAIENKLELFDETLSNNIFALDLRNPSSSRLLERGDKIVAVDGIAVSSAFDIIKLLQTPRVLMIAERDTDKSKILWKESDKYFDEVFTGNNFSTLVENIGTPLQKKNVGSLYLLNPVIPKTLEERLLQGSEKEEILKELAFSEKQIQKIDDQQKRKEALQDLENFKKEMRLGILLEDKMVKYNPNPFFLFYSSLKDIWKTLTSLITGKLSPKWMSGPVGIVQVIHHSWSLGYLEALYWLGVISLNLGIINLFPLPVLDGGHIMFSIVEIFTRKPIKTKTMEKLIIPFIVLLIGAILFFTYNDIIRLIKHFF